MIPEAQWYIDNHAENIFRGTVYPAPGYATQADTFPWCVASNGSAVQGHLHSRSG